MVMGQIEVFSHHSALQVTPEGMDCVRVDFAPTETEGLYSAMVSEEVAAHMESVPGCAHRDVVVLDGLEEEAPEDQEDETEEDSPEGETPAVPPKKRGGRPRKVVDPV